MESSFFVQGYVIGFSIATTIGVSGILCLQNMMTGRVRIALASVFAAALADMLFAGLITFGLGSVQQFLLTYQAYFSVVAGLTLCGLGLQKIFQSFAMQRVHVESTNVLQAFFSVFFLAFFDPVSLLDFAALFMGLTLDFSVVANAIAFVLGLGCGSLTWWLALCCVILYFAQSISVNFFYRVQQLAGVGIFGLGSWILIQKFVS